MRSTNKFEKSGGKTAGVPCCPNHGAPLEDLGFPIPRKGRGTCPISHCKFDFEAESDQSMVARDKFGEPIKTLTWNVEGEEDG